MRPLFLVVACLWGAGTMAAPLTAQRVFFGHQSVGKNILDGLSDVAKERGAPLAVVPWKPGAPIQGPAIYETAIGRNEAPLSKLEAFQALVDGGVGGTADVAFFKFCYID